MTALSLEDISKSYGPTRAVSKINLQIAEGSRTAIVGPSGSGKTTLLRLVAGFEAPDAGKIHIDGLRIADASVGVPAHRRNVGIVMQEGALFPHLSLIDNIRFGIRKSKDSKAHALALMDLVELDRSMADRQPHQLSGGQQQRVALARALARQPRLMLLDEPFSALDAGLREQLRSATMRILAKAGVATLLVTHDQEEAISFADQLVVLRDGRLVQAGPPQELYRAPADPVTAAFLGQAIVLDAEIRGGRARCILGEVAVDGQQTSSSAAKILLRPEQLRVVPAAEGGTWRILTIEQLGPQAHVKVALENGGAETCLTFRAPNVDLPPAGSLVGLEISGRAYQFP
ncbi:ABC transporter ATP-binding protein [Ensifer sp.]|jgi:iron(III) transport system ATP-binding protein|uniref:ABC transporter ATP-binding protein n=1 Tax=Ensifer sp. TaxID=1872086 RepID=UPI002E0F270B|nr:ABC transporter ATP-binding protein [Ensifer sp.]